MIASRCSQRRCFALLAKTLLRVARKDVASRCSQRRCFALLAKTLLRCTRNDVASLRSQRRCFALLAMTPFWSLAMTVRVSKRHCERSEAITRTAPDECPFYRSPWPRSAVSLRRSCFSIRRAGMRRRACRSNVPHRSNVHILFSLPILRVTG